MTVSRTTPDVIFVGPLPPPVHGQSVATEGLRTVLESHGLDVRVIDTGEGGPGWQGRVRRAGRLARAAFVILTRRSRHLYVSVNSSLGIVATVLYALLARLTRKRLTLHHHVYRYIATGDPLVALLARVAGADALHLANCDAMALELKARYPDVRRASGYGNVGFVDPALRSLTRREPRPCITLGHMSNLTEAKGLGRAIDAFRAARRSGLNVSLLLAGPCADPGAEETIARAEEEFGAALEYMGPVYGSDKLSFFQRTDVFLFPTRYVNEAGPIVNLEAMSAGTPVISTAQCCIPSTLAGGGGIAVAAIADFPAEAVRFISAYASDPAGHSYAARARFDQLAVEQKELEAKLLDHFAS